MRSFECRSISIQMSMHLDQCLWDGAPFEVEQLNIQFEIVPLCVY